MRLPMSKDVAHQLYLYRENLRGWKLKEGDVRLQVYEDGQWLLHTGDSQYDQDHRGYWSSGSIEVTDTLKKLCDIADDLLYQVSDQAVEAGLTVCGIEVPDEALQ